MADRVEVARGYYRAIDEDDYDELRALLASGFVHERPDRTLEGPDRFVRFMREERPMTDTSHEVDAIYSREEGEGIAVRGEGIAVRGRLLRDGEILFGFVDVFSYSGVKVETIRTYTR